MEYGGVSSTSFLDANLLRSPKFKKFCSLTLGCEYFSSVFKGMDASSHGASVLQIPCRAICSLGKSSLVFQLPGWEIMFFF